MINCNDWLQDTRLNNNILNKFNLINSLFSLLQKDQKCDNEFDGILDRGNQTWKIDENINQWKPHRVSRFPARNAAKYSLWSLFDPGHTEGFGCTSGKTDIVASC